MLSAEGACCAARSPADRYAALALSVSSLAVLLLVAGYRSLWHAAATVVSLALALMARCGVRGGVVRPLSVRWCTCPTPGCASMVC
jgi:hypothetical protein